MDKQLAKKLNMVIKNEYWPYFDEYLKQELDRAYIKFDSSTSIEGFCSVQAEIRVYKQLLNIKEFIRQSMEN